MADRFCQLADNRRQISLMVGDAFGRGYSRRRSECGARGREDTARPRAASGIIRPALRPVREVLPGLGQAGAGNARLAAPSLSPPGWGERDKAKRPRRVPGNMAWSRAEGARAPTVRAVVERRKASALRFQRAPHRRMRRMTTYACRRSASLFCCCCCFW
jgi:hypothetical protein